jgi:hypothetical protein
VTEIISGRQALGALHHELEVAEPGAEPLGPPGITAEDVGHEAHDLRGLGEELALRLVEIVVGRDGKPADALLGHGS